MSPGRMTATVLAAHLAMGLGGKVTYLNEIEAAKMKANNDGQIDRAWEPWKIQATAG